MNRVALRHADVDVAAVVYVNAVGVQNQSWRDRCSRGIHGRSRCDGGVQLLLPISGGGLRGVCVVQ